MRRSTRVAFLPVRRRRALLQAFICAAGLSFGGGCERPSGAGQPTTAASANAPAAPDESSPAPVVGPIVPFDENESWSPEDAVLRLDDPKKAVRAAVRLVRLADETPVIVPAPLPRAIAARLKVARLTEYGVWALGYALPGEEGVLRSPVLLDAGQNVVRLADGADEEALRIRVSEDVELFPHLLLLPDRIWFISSLDETAEAAKRLVRAAPEEVCFRLADREGYPYIELRLEPENGEAKSVAEYHWDPYELQFAGPAKDKLPFPPGGNFELDIKQSNGLIPLGGEIPEPDENIMPEQNIPDPDRRDWARGGRGNRRPRAERRDFPRVASTPSEDV